ncbi:hypothetical protein THIOM_001194 [Candidatus Thiomargarita nelsonii]|uniref:Uncharacterized protein n=1 Tax=Candidatus Thiomargarita nelsonii TaxID=1003181 RepID=A0A176S4E2_9GAMM|nr:hypothetical protein THIOM_001194 [Candidatus Thiomargarita nelsonii]
MLIFRYLRVIFIYIFLIKFQDKSWTPIIKRLTIYSGLDIVNYRVNLVLMGDSC